MTAEEIDQMENDLVKMLEKYQSVKGNLESEKFANKTEVAKLKLGQQLSSGINALMNDK